MIPTWHTCSWFDSYEQAGRQSEVTERILCVVCCQKCRQMSVGCMRRLLLTTTCGNMKRPVSLTVRYVTRRFHGRRGWRGTSGSMPFRRSHCSARSVMPSLRPPARWGTTCEFTPATGLTHAARAGNVSRSRGRAGRTSLRTATCAATSVPSAASSTSCPCISVTTYWRNTVTLVRTSVSSADERSNYLGSCTTIGGTSTRASVPSPVTNARCGSIRRTFWSGTLKPSTGVWNRTSVTSVTGRSHSPTVCVSTLGFTLGNSRTHARSVTNGSHSSELPGLTCRPTRTLCMKMTLVVQQMASMSLKQRENVSSTDCSFLAIPAVFWWCWQLTVYGYFLCKLLKFYHFYDEC